jgi:hypothetical protein
MNDSIAKAASQHLKCRERSGLGWEFRSASAAATRIVSQMIVTFMDKP